LDALILQRGTKPKTIVSDNGIDYAGARTGRLVGNTSRLANQCRTALSRASMGVSETSA